MSPVAVDPVQPRSALGIRRVRDVDNPGYLVGYFCRGHVDKAAFAADLRKVYRLRAEVHDIRHSHFRFKPDGDIEKHSHYLVGCQAVTVLEVQKWG